MNLFEKQWKIFEIFEMQDFNLSSAKKEFLRKVVSLDSNPPFEYPEAKYFYSCNS